MAKSLNSRSKKKIKLPISAVMVIYNEENLLERALKSFYDLVDEIIIVHDGKCTDKSLEIAKKYTKNVFIRPHLGSAEPHRVFTYKKARNDWILVVDADSYLSHSLKKKLSDLIKDKVDIYEFNSPFLYKNKFHEGAYSILLFKKTKIYFIGSTHEYPKPLNINVITKRVKYKLFNHPNYENISWEKFRTKWRSRAKVQAKQLAGDFNKIPKFNYSGKEWDFPNNLRIKYPILFGIIGSSFFHFIIGVKEAINRRDGFYLVLGFYMSLYFCMLYLYVFIYKNFKINE